MVLSWHSSGPSSKVHPAPQISTGSFHKGGNGLVMAFLWTFLKGASSSTDLNREFSQGRQWSCHGIPLDLPQRCIQLHRSQQGVFTREAMVLSWHSSGPSSKVHPAPQISTGSFSQPVSPTNLPGCFSTYLVVQEDS